MRQCGPQHLLLTCAFAEAGVDASNLNRHMRLGAQSAMRYKLLQKKESFLGLCFAPDWDSY